MLEAINSFIDRIFANEPLIFVVSKSIYLQDIPYSLYLSLSIQILFTFGPLILLPILDTAIMGSKIKSSQEVTLKRCLLLLAPILLLSVLIRSYRFGETFPPGIEQDEYIWSSNYLDILAGSGNVFGMGSFGIPVLQGSVTTLFFLIFGLTANSMRFWSLITGALFPIPLFFLVRWLYGTRVAFVASLFACVSPYPVFYSRIISGGRILLNATSTATIIYAGTRLTKKSGIFYCLFGGLLLGFTTYDYFAARALPLFIISLLVLWCVNDKRHHELGKRSFKLSLVVLGFSLALLPLIVNSLGKIGEFFDRINQESVAGEFLSGNWSVIQKQFLNTFSMFLMVPDGGRAIWFSHPELIPFVPIVAVFFACGLLIIIFGRKRLELALALIILSLPTLLSTQPPDSHRAILSIIPATIIAASGICWLVSIVPIRGVFTALLVFSVAHSLVRLDRFYSDPTFLYRQFHTQWRERIATLQSMLPKTNVEKVGTNFRVSNVKLISTFDFYVGARVMLQGLEYERFNWQKLLQGQELGVRFFNLETSSKWVQKYFSKTFMNGFSVVVPRGDDNELFFLTEHLSCNENNCPKQSKIELRLLKNGQDVVAPSIVPFPVMNDLIELIPGKEPAKVDSMFRNSEIDTVEWRITETGTIDLPLRFNVQKGVLVAELPGEKPVSVDASNSDHPLLLSTGYPRQGTIYRLTGLTQRTKLIPVSLEDLSSD